MIVKIISGGQTGADRGGLEAGKELGLVEHTSSSYPPRTVDNVRNSDGTIIFGNINSPGCKLTISTCIKFKKPYIILIKKDIHIIILTLFYMFNFSD